MIALVEFLDGNVDEAKQYLETYIGIGSAARPIGLEDFVAEWKKSCRESAPRCPTISLGYRQASADRVKR